MALMYTHGRQMFSTLKSPFLKFRKHLTVHKWTDLTPTVVQKLSAFQTGKSTPLSFRWFCLFPFSRTVCFTNRTFNNLAFKHINYKHILCLEQFTHKSLVLLTVRTFSTSTCRWAAQRRNIHSSNKTGLIYMVAILVFMLGGAYAGVPLYKVFCQASGLGGQAVKGHDTSNIESMEKVERPILVRFNADVASSMRWNFRPQQTEVTVYPGETALAFYTAKNPTDKPIIGISTYNILPYDAGQYFNKIQCFCFEEQRLNPNEQVDMPVFFYIDPEFAEDPKLQNTSIITLSYTFFEAHEGLQLPLPGYPQTHNLPVVTVS